MASIDLDARGLVDLAPLDPVARLGGEEYGRLAELRAIPRPASP